ncbi:hypothetical protein Q3G72_032105 [Acer saccharum]|nr:hypothetical protein Q3G72_032105 [Acer saccharum]
MVYPFEIRVLYLDGGSRCRTMISYPRVLDQLERQLAKVISAADTLREEVRKSDLERKESDKGIVIQRDSAADPVTLPYPEDVAALPCVHHEIPPPQ